MRNTKAVLQKIEALPPERIAEVEDFVEFLGAKAARLAALDRLLAVAPAVEAAGVPPMSMEEIDAEVKAVRAERRARNANHTPSQVATGGDLDL